MEDRVLEERTYHLVKGVGAANIVLGVIAVVTGVAVGVITIVNGARLLKGKNNISF